jgi:hypothetical protein
MTTMDQAKLEAALKKAVVQAIKKVGLSTFKRTSMFGSNEMAALKQAA